MAYKGYFCHEIVVNGVHKIEVKIHASRRDDLTEDFEQTTYMEIRGEVRNLQNIVKQVVVMTRVLCVTQEIFRVVIYFLFLF